MFRASPDSNQIDLLNYGSPGPADRSREYPSAYDPASAAPHPGATAPSSSAPYPAYPGWERPGYSFRPLDKAPAGDRWQGPYQDRGRSGDQGYADRWTAPDGPQWGSAAPVQPPSPQRMHPSWNMDTGRRLTARRASASIASRISPRSQTLTWQQPP